jgi:Na+/melibiose symporter-like transporter
MFSALFYWTNKLGTSLGTLGSGLLLNLTGFSIASGRALSHQTILKMKIVDTLVPTLAIVIGMVMLLGYPLTAKRMEAVQETLERRKTLPKGVAIP